MKKGTKIILGVVVIGAMAGGIWYARTNVPEAEVVTERVSRGSVAQTVSVTGKLMPETYADLSFTRTGRISDVAVSEGDRVDAGRDIASLDDASLRSEWNAALIALSIAEENEKLARRDWSGLKPEERAAKKLMTEQARETVRAIGTAMKDLTLVSPIAGTVSASDLRIGETAVAGAVAVRVSGDGGFVIESQVPESDVAEIVVGMKARVTFDALSRDDVFDAEAVGMDAAATVSQGVVSYRVEFRLSSPDDRLREGMTANIDIETGRADDSIAVPFRAVSRESGRSFVEVKRGENVFEKTEVATGIEGDDGLIEVRTGLREGDEVVVSRKK